MALSAVVLFLLVRALRVTPMLRDAILIGVVAGLCALAKVSGLAMLVLAVPVLAYVNRTNLRRLVVQEIAALAAFAVFAGWWYLRNIVLYGEIYGTRRMIEIFGGRVAPLTPEGWQARGFPRCLKRSGSVSVGAISGARMGLLACRHRSAAWCLGLGSWSLACAQTVTDATGRGPYAALF